MLESIPFPATYALMALSIIISGYAFTVDRKINDRFDLDIGRILGKGEWYRLITSGFVHADPIHLLFNMFTLYFFGRLVEYYLGTWPFVILYFGCELAANLLTLALKRGQRGYSSLGASGAISGVLLSGCLFQPFSKIYIMPLPIGIPAFIYAVFYIGYSTFQVRDNVRDGIAHEAHLGGALAGVVLTLLFQPAVLQTFLAHFGGGLGAG
jgi:membrane associated rhomboid family serine protease